MEDYVAVYDGDSITSPPIGYLCDEITNGTLLQSTGNVMTLHFHTDDSGVNGGFRIYADAGKKLDTKHNCLADVNRTFMF